MDAIEALKRGWMTMLNSIPLVLIIFGLNVISAGILLALVGLTPTPEKVNSVIVPVLFFFVILIVLWIVLQGGIIASLLSRIKANDLKLGDFMGNCFKFCPRLLGLNCIGGFLFMAMVFTAAVLVGIFIALGQGKNIFFNAIALLVGIISLAAVIFVSLSLFFGQYASVIDDSGVMAAIKKGFKAFRRWWGRSVVLFILLALQGLVFSLLINGISALLIKAVGENLITVLINVILTSTLNGFIGIYAGASVVNLLLSYNESIAAETPAA